LLCSRVLLACKLTVSLVLANILSSAAFEQRLIDVLHALQRRSRESVIESDLSLWMHICQSFTLATVECISFLQQRDQGHPLLFSRLLSALHHYSSDNTRDGQYAFVGNSDLLWQHLREKSSGVTALVLQP